MKFVGVGFVLAFAVALGWLVYVNSNSSITSSAAQPSSIIVDSSLHTEASSGNQFGINLIATSARDGHAVIELKANRESKNTALYKLGDSVLIRAEAEKGIEWKLEHIDVARIVLRSTPGNQVLLVKQRELDKPSLVQFISNQPKSDDAVSVNVVTQ